MNAFRREWGAITFVLTVMVGAIAVAISLVIAGAHPPAVATLEPCPSYTPYVITPSPTPSATPTVSPSAKATATPTPTPAPTPSPTAFNPALANCPTAPLPPTSPPTPSPGARTGTPAPAPTATPRATPLH
jgi:hypothetical protein